MAHQMHRHRSCGESPTEVLRQPAFMSRTSPLNGGPRAPEGRLLNRLDSRVGRVIVRVFDSAATAPLGKTIHSSATRAGPAGAGIHATKLQRRWHTDDWPAIRPVFVAWFKSGFHFRDRRRGIGRRWSRANKGAGHRHRWRFWMALQLARVRRFPHDPISRPCSVRHLPQANRRRSSVGI